MSWDVYHTESERLAAEAEALRACGDNPGAAELYRRAAEAEESALAAVDPTKSRTRGITGVSAVSLWHKAGQSAEVLRVGRRLLAEPLPRFAHVQIREIVDLHEQSPGTGEQRFEVEITVRQTLRYAVDAADRNVAERTAMERWRLEQGDSRQPGEYELVAVRTKLTA